MSPIHSSSNSYCVFRVYNLRLEKLPSKDNEFEFVPKRKTPESRGWGLIIEMLNH